jgi:hypothetical protein
MTRFDIVASACGDMKSLLLGEKVGNNWDHEVAFDVKKRT